MLPQQFKFHQFIDFDIFFLYLVSLVCANSYLIFVVYVRFFQIWLHRPIAITTIIIIVKAIVSLQMSHV